MQANTARVIITLAIFAIAIHCFVEDVVPENPEVFKIDDVKSTGDENQEIKDTEDLMEVGRRRSYYIGVKVSDRKHAGSEDTIELQLENKEGKTTAFKKVDSKFKTGSEFSKRLLLENIGEPSDIKLVRLRTHGTDGLLLKTLKVETKRGKKKKEQNYAPGKRFLMCRTEDSPLVSDACTITLSPATESGTHSCKECKAVVPAAPKPLRSDFKPPARGNGRYSLRNKSSQLQYDGFAVWVDCSMNAAYRFEYMAYEDCGCHPRHHGFKLDPKSERISSTCQQRNGKTYKATEGVAFDRGHLVPANHLDHDEDAISQSNYMTNILPQAALMNRGSWLETEELVECLRDKEPVHVLGGAAYNSKDPRYNWFQDSHNVKTPSWFWKVVTVANRHAEDYHRIAFWIPNNEVAKRGTMGKYVVSLASLEKNLAKFGQPQKFDVPEEEKSHVPKTAWDHIKGCDKSLA
jgi:endonuclease G